MGIKTAIEWCDSSVNPVMGCSGCELYSPDPSKNLCYAADLCKWRAGGKGWPVDFNQPEHFPGRLEKAINWSDLTGKERPSKPWLNGMPRVVFVNDLSDGFCPDVDPHEWLEPHIQAMAEASHIWLLLTKWPWEMRQFFDELDHPIPQNFWLGTTLTGLKPRRDNLRANSMSLFNANTWLSVEPLLDDVTESFPQGELIEKTINWIAGGGASGRNSPPTHPFNARALRDFAQGWGIPFFWKQWGEWLPTARHFDDGSEAWSQDDIIPGVLNRWVAPDGTFCTDMGPSGMAAMARIGKKRAGRTLDGVVWSEMPEVMK